MQELANTYRSASSYNAAQMEAVDEIKFNPWALKKSHSSGQHKLQLSKINKAIKYFMKNQIIRKTPLTEVPQLSQAYDAKIYFKREDQQRGRTYKIRGAYNKYLELSKHQRQVGIVLASDGNFAVSYSIIAGIFKTKCVVFVPQPCYAYKIEIILKEGGQFVEVIQKGIDYEECVAQAMSYAQKNKIPFVHPNDDIELMNGFATIAKQLDDDKTLSIDVVLVPAGSGALASSIASYFKQASPEIKIFAVQPENCKPFSKSILDGQLSVFQRASRFCNGSSVRSSNKTCVEIGKTSIDGFVEVSEMKISEKIIKLYSYGYICEPSGALSITGLDKMGKYIKGKNVVCILSGANIDLTKLDEAREMSMISKGYKNFYIIELPNRKNSVHELITKCFKQTDIISIQYSHKVSKQTSQALLSVQSLSQEDVEFTISKLVDGKYVFQNINSKEQLIDLFF